MTTRARCQLHLHTHHVSRTTPSTTALRLTCPSRAYSRVGDGDLDYDFGYKWKHLRLHPTGRIVGTGRRRQRVVPVDLVSKSLDKPASVIVLHDLHTPPSPPPSPPPLQPHSRTPPLLDELTTRQPCPKLSVRDIEHAIIGHDPAPEEADVNASIDRLRPGTTTPLDQTGFERLRRRLLRGYTLAQLSRYLQLSLGPPARRTAVELTKALQRSPWQPGRTPLHVRRKSVVQSTARDGRKQWMADRIIRLAWRVTVDAEEQEVGELEFQLQPWQLSMLVDLSSNERPYYESLILSRLLLDATVVEHYRPDCAVRITGRRRDAEQVACQLEAALLEVHQLHLNRANFAAQLLNKTPISTKDVCTDEELSRISKLTASVISSRGRNVITIYNRSRGALEYAYRLIISLLDRSTMFNTDITFALSGAPMAGPANISALVQVSASPSKLHSHGKDYDLARQVMARECALPFLLMTPKQVNETTLDISAYLQNLKPAHQCMPHRGALGRGYWQHGARSDSNWRAHFVKLLQGRAVPSAFTAGAQQSTHLEPFASSRHTAMQQRLPAVETALSYFRTYRPPETVSAKDVPGVATSVDWQAPQLIAHLVALPKSQEGYSKPPRVELRFQPAATRQCELTLTEMRLMLETQIVNAPLPTEAVDLSFVRNSTIVADIDSAMRDAHISAFVETVKLSAQAKDDKLFAPSKLIIHIPAWLINGSSQKQSEAQDVPITYLLERLEQTHETMFVANDKASHELDLGVQSAMNSLGAILYLGYEEVDGGAILGSGSTLSVNRTWPKNHNTGARPAEVNEGSEVGVDGAGCSVEQLVKAAVAVVGLFTRAASGSLPSAFLKQ